MSTQNTRHALLSVFDKTGITELAQSLISLGYTLISSGGTHNALSKAQIPVREVSDITQFPEMMGGRVKTLHPKVHGGILARRDQDEATLAEHDIPAIDLVVVNLYPFAQTISQADCTLSQAIEQIDIGGPALIRAAAKNHSAVTVITDTADYEALLSDLQNNDAVKRKAFREKMALKAFQQTAHYDSLISQYLGAQYQADTEFPAVFLPSLQQQQVLRYGENPHQNAALYREAFPAQPNLVDAKQLQGKPLSYNNLADADAALDLVNTLQTAGCVIVKHANPCGVAIGENLQQAYEKAYACDPTSAFGGIIAFNNSVDVDLVDRVISQQFVEVILAPGFTAAALNALKEKPNLRVLALPNWSKEPQPPFAPTPWHCKRIAGGVLIQSPDSSITPPEEWQVVTQKHPEPHTWEDLKFAWQVVRAVKSNAIVFAKSGQTLGIGAGQMSRVFSTRIACEKANEANVSLSQSVMASDAFFPFADGIEAGLKAGVAAIIQPGGSKRDPEVIAAADKAGVAMVLTAERHFNH